MKTSQSLSFLWLMTISLVGLFGAVSTQTGFAEPGEMNGANVFVNLAKKTVPSVVNISTRSTVKNPYPFSGQDDFLRRFFGDFLRRQPGPESENESEMDEEGIVSPSKKDPRRQPKSVALGTGFIIDSSGLILTNNHVVAGADEIKISFTEESDEKPTDAEVVGRDTLLDVALIKVKNKRKMVPLPLGDSDSAEVGEYVVAVGNPFGQGHSVTHGIISAKGRVLTPENPFLSHIQTDAPINPGNSGGPLLNLKGEVIGINNAIDQRAQGIGFAIPVNLVKQILPQLRTNGVVTRGYIGVAIGDLTPQIAKEISAPKDLKGALVSHVYADQPAAKAGVQEFDLITKFNGKEIRSRNELVEKVTGDQVGETVPMVVFRNGKSVTLNIKIAARPTENSGEERLAPKKGKGKDHRSKVNLGMTVSDVTPEISRDLDLPSKSSGVVVTRVEYGGPADRAGIVRGDLILEVKNQGVVKDVQSFYSIVKEKKTYLLKVRRVDPQGQEAFQIIALEIK